MSVDRMQSGRQDLSCSQCDELRSAYGRIMEKYNDHLKQYWSQKEQLKKTEASNKLLTNMLQEDKMHRVFLQNRLDTAEQALFLSKETVRATPTTDQLSAVPYEESVDNKQTFFESEDDTNKQTSAGRSIASSPKNHPSDNNENEAVRPSDTIGYMLDRQQKDPFLQSTTKAVLPQNGSSAQQLLTQGPDASDANLNSLPMNPSVVASRIQRKESAVSVLDKPEYAVLLTKELTGKAGLGLKKPAPALRRAKSDETAEKDSEAESDTTTTSTSSSESEISEKRPRRTNRTHVSENANASGDRTKLTKRNFGNSAKVGHDVFCRLILTAANNWDVIAVSQQFKDVRQRVGQNEGNDPVLVYELRPVDFLEARLQLRSLQGAPTAATKNTGLPNSKSVDTAKVLETTQTGGYKEWQKKQMLAEVPEGSRTQKPEKNSRSGTTSTNASSKSKIDLAQPKAFPVARSTKSMQLKDDFTRLKYERPSPQWVARAGAARQTY